MDEGKKTKAKEKYDGTKVKNAEVQMEEKRKQ